MNMIEMIHDIIILIIGDLELHDTNAIDLAQGIMVIPDITEITLKEEEVIFHNIIIMIVIDILTPDIIKEMNKENKDQEVEIVIWKGITTMIMKVDQEVHEDQIENLDMIHPLHHHQLDKQILEIHQIPSQQSKI